MEVESMKAYLRTLLLVAAVACIGLSLAHRVSAHCEIPCGIYEDRMRVDMLREHVRTIEKSMQMIKQLNEDDLMSRHQMIRWVFNKEDHANKIQEIVYQYFMTQRVKPADASEGDAYEAYAAKITLLHAMLVQAMKCKQTTDESHVAELRSLIESFEKAYFEHE
jgi:nickel superoxide dismutase